MSCSIKSDNGNVLCGEFSSEGYERPVCLSPLTTETVVEHDGRSGLRSDWYVRRAPQGEVVDCELDRLNRESHAAIP